MKTGRKGIAPRYPVLKHVLKYDAIIGPLLSHLRCYNTLETNMMRDVAHHVNNSVFLHVRSTVPPVSKESSSEEKIRHNDSISWLRTRYIKTSNKISKLNFGLPS